MTDDDGAQTRLATYGTLATGKPNAYQLADLRAALREGGTVALDAAIESALVTKPRRHDFRIERDGAPAVARHMSVTGG